MFRALKKKTGWVEELGPTLSERTWKDSWKKKASPDWTRRTQSHLEGLQK